MQKCCDFLRSYFCSKASGLNVFEYIFSIVWKTPTVPTGFLTEGKYKTFAIWVDLLKVRAKCINLRILKAC